MLIQLLPSSTVALALMPLNTNTGATPKVSDWPAGVK